MSGLMGFNGQRRAALRNPLLAGRFTQGVLCHFLRFGVSPMLVAAGFWVASVHDGSVVAAVLTADLSRYLLHYRRQPVADGYHRHLWCPQPPGGGSDCVWLPAAAMTVAANRSTGKSVNGATGAATILISNTKGAAATGACSGDSGCHSTIQTISPCRAKAPTNAASQPYCCCRDIVGVTIKWVMGFRIPAVPGQPAPPCCNRLCRAGS